LARDGCSNGRPDPDFNPGEYSVHDLTVPPAQVVVWSTALAPLRTVASAA
jgi:hypothetical protein